MRLPFATRAFFRAAALASIVVCSCDSATPSSLVLSLNTNDLAISGDTNLIGLYIAQLDANGAVIRVDSHEAAPLRLPAPSNEVKMPFPASLVLVSGERKTERVHIRLIAYRDAESREVVTMRESRTRVPTQDGDSRLLRLNLFFSNQANVVDNNPSAAVSTSRGGLETRTSDLDLRDQSASMTAADFDRFTSICDGAPAPAGKTSDDRGRCIDLDVSLEQLPVFAAGATVLGMSEDDRCYDVDLAFQERGDRAIERVQKSELAADGECRVQLPGRYDPKLLNVAMVTSEEAFEFNSETFKGKSLRPLAANLAFTLEGNTLVLPANVCKLARRDVVDSLLLSQRTDSWGGGEPVCAPWVKARVRHDFERVGPGGGTDASVPVDAASDGGASDAGDGGGAPKSGFADYSVVIDGALFDVAALDGEVALATQAGSQYTFALLDATRFDLPSTAVPVPTASASFYEPQLRGLRVGTKPAFYVQESGGESMLYQLTPSNFTTITTPGTSPVALPLADGAAALAWIVGHDATPAQLQMAKLNPNNPAQLLPDIVQSHFLAGTTYLNLARARGVFVGDAFYLVNGEDASMGWKCETANCTPLSLVQISATGVGAVSQLDDKPIGLFSTSDGSSAFVQLDTGDVLGPLLNLGPLGTDLPSGNGYHCVTQIVDGDADKVLCFSDAAIRGNQLGSRVELLTGVDAVQITGDASYLYLAYQCSVIGNEVHVARMPWSKIGVDNAALINRCAGTP